MRVAAYAGASIALASAVVLRALHERPNFYSASVYLAQSSACRMILLNFLLFCVGSFIFGLQRLLYGSLRPSEIEQLWDKAWYAVTETALAMTAFRDEIGGWFFVMFVCLLAGKVWGWIAEGRVEVLNQQPPNSPRWFHTRLVISLALSEFFAVTMLRYCFRTLLHSPKPGIMVLFAFEFAILGVMASSTTLRYALSLVEIYVTKIQTYAKLEERKQEIRAARAAAAAAQVAAASETQDGTISQSTTIPTDLPREEDIDVEEIDVPGWQEKGRWVFYLDLLTDFFKLVIYLVFFTVLMMFHGIPIHILRDVYMTMRSFIKRISDFRKYRKATRDMNARYPDATVEELAGRNECIICREEMRAWEQPRVPMAEAEAPRRPQLLVDERQRAKKLPCGHILHFGCLRSWLERQQACPTCRASVLVSGNGEASANAANGNAGAPQPPVQPDQQDAPPQGQLQRRPNPGRRRNVPRARTFDLGPLHITFAAGNRQQVRNALQQLQEQPHLNNLNEETRSTGSHGLGTTYRDWQEQLTSIENQVTREIMTLNATQEQLVAVRALQGELTRLRAAQENTRDGSLMHGTFNTAFQPLAPIPVNGQMSMQGLTVPSLPPFLTQAHQQAFTAGSQQQVLGSNHPDLPDGVVIPEGWTLMPLHRVTYGQPNAVATSASMSSDISARAAETQHTPAVPTVANGTTSDAIVGPSEGLPDPPPSTRPSSQVPEAYPHLVQPHPPDGISLPLSTNNASEGSSEPAIKIPDWSNSNSANAAATHLASTSEPSEATGAENGHAKGDKGKARAATVEDVIDECND